MPRLTISFQYPGDNHYQEAEVAATLLRFVARITTWGRLPTAGNPMELTDHLNRPIGLAQIEE